MKLSEVFEDGKGIFATVFKPNYPVQYAAIFGDVDPNVMDGYVTYMYGDKTLIAKITTETAASVVNSVISLQVDNWVKQAKAFTAEYDVTKPILSQTDSKKTVTIDETTGTNKKDADKAFNDTAFTENNETTSDTNKNRTETTSDNVSLTGLGTSSSKSISTEIIKEIELRRDNWKKSVIFAIVNEITSSIYE